MTLDNDTLKTNEFQQRRKLRLQQVREQSKDIAKKIRQRAEVEKLRHASNFDNKKEKEYFECQEKLVQRLQQLYTDRLNNVGSAHRNVSEKKHEDIVEKEDLSKLRGKEAAIALKKQKQEILDKQKQVLDRKLKAREAANELSREKSSTVVKNLTKSVKNTEDIPDKASEPGTSEQNNEKERDGLVKNDMATQWESEVEKDPEPVPTLLLPEDPDSANINKIDKTRRPNLFALSDEMTLNLSEGNAVPAPKPSLTLISEHIQNRALRLREPELTKKRSDDLQSIKQTILRSRTARTDGTKDKSFRSNETDINVNAKNSVTVYNHNTKNTRNIPFGDINVNREEKSGDDAYTQAFRETAITDGSREKCTKQQEVRNKVAIQRQNVDKEYRETLAFLNSLPKDVNTMPIRNTFMDEEQQRLQKEKHQRKLQEEFNKVEKESYKRNCKHSRKRVTISDRSKSKSPYMTDIRDRQFQYSWMPVPESDSNLAIHTLPTKDKGPVKFSQVNSYHEYRSRHKHTPPTKDNDKPRRVVETVVVEQSDSELETSETSSVDNLNLDRSDDRMQDADRIIIYKILNSKKEKKSKETKNKKANADTRAEVEINKSKQKNLSLNKSNEDCQEGAFEQMNEGIYKAVSKSGDNINLDTNSARETDVKEKEINNNEIKSCCCKKILDEKQDSRRAGGESMNRTSDNCNKCKHSIEEPAETTSSSSIKTNEKINAPAGFMKLLDEAGQESSKFYIGASGFLKDDNYEVIIQLRKKDGDNLDDKTVKVPIITQPVITQNKTADEINTKSQSTSQEEIAQTVDIASQEEVVHEPGLQNLQREDITTQSKELVKDIEHTEKPSTCDIGVHTSFKNSFAIPDHVPKTSSVCRPGTSTFTQTSFSSPLLRPPFMHSSSTSTTYMSPPDIILPRSLRRYPVTSEDVYDSSSSMNNHEKRSDSETKSHSSREKKVKAKRNKCKKCVTITPPNTGDDSESHKIKKCHKCISCCQKTGTKCNKSKKKTHSNTKCDKLGIPAFKNKLTSASAITKMHKSHIDPDVKKYVNKLLSLNKEGLKAVEIINQDCSEVTTPSNSIINVPSNINKRNAPIENKISLEQIKNILKNKIVEENKKHAQVRNEKAAHGTVKVPKKPQVTKKKTIHKVKSLNISKRVSKPRKNINSQANLMSDSKISSSSVNDRPISNNTNQSRSSRKNNTSSPFSNRSDKEIFTKTHKTKLIKMGDTRHDVVARNFVNTKSNPPKKTFLPLNKATIPFASSDSEPNYKMNFITPQEPYINSTQTTGIIESDINFMKIAEDRLHNMEKIADLTDKCTKRLSNLAKILEEVRKNKSLVYSQISSSETSSGSDIKSDVNVHEDPKVSFPNTKILRQDIDLENVSPPMKINELSDKDSSTNNTLQFMELLKDIPKPDISKSMHSSTMTDTNYLNDKPQTNNEQATVKGKAKPPPALSRHLKHGLDVFTTPHELSTVVEVDSPMSVKLKNQSSRLDIQDKTKNNSELRNSQELKTEPQIVKTQNDQVKSNLKMSATDSSDDSKLQMMDMKQFNDIMLKPFISLQEYAKHNKVVADGSNADVLDFPLKDNDVSSFHSESSLPDVMAELLKRNIINEPFKYDTASNNNSTSVSSESSLSVLALSKTLKRKKTVAPKQKENHAETSETLSFSSNPDLENALQKLGMGWASSTLKKTKERLALTSSSSTSSTSLRRFKIKSFSQDLPDLASDTMSSLMSIRNDSKLAREKQNRDDSLKNAVQQTSLTNSMTVKEFLNNELAKKITFNKSNSKGASEFISLYETKMPEEIKNIKEGNEDEQSISGNSANNNRARTSTPVQIFKSAAYHSSSSTNTSNGLFSIGDDLSSVKGTSNSLRNYSTSDKEDLTIPNYSLKLKKGSDLSKSD